MARYSPRDSGEVNIGTSPSLLYGNLSCNGHFGVFAQNHQVFRFLEATASGAVKPECTAIPLKDSSDITQASWCFVDSRPYLVTTSFNGIHVFAEDAKTVEFVFPLKSSDIDFDQTEGSHFTRGITAVEDVSHVCVGASTGHIFVLEVGSGGINLADTKACHKYPICALGNVGEILASSDDYGTIKLWDAKKDYTELCRFNGHGFPCIGVKGRGNYIVGAYVSGHIRVFKIREQCLFTEISGHARPISALDIHPSVNCFATVGEDSVLNVWELPSKDNGDQVTLFMTAETADSYFTGVCFSRNGTGNILANSYDKDTTTRSTYGDMATWWSMKNLERSEADDINLTPYMYYNTHIILPAKHCDDKPGALSKPPSTTFIPLPIDLAFLCTNGEKMGEAVVLCLFTAAVTILMVASFSLVKHFVDPRFHDMTPKIICSMTLTFVLTSICIIPIDVYLSQSRSYSVETADAVYGMYQFLFTLTLISLFLVIPYAYFFFDAPDTMSKGMKIRFATKYMFQGLVTLALFMIVGMLIDIARFRGVTDPQGILLLFENRDFWLQSLEVCMGAFFLLGMIGIMIYCSFGLAAMPIVSILKRLNQNSFAYHDPHFEGRREILLQKRANNARKHMLWRQYRLTGKRMSRAQQKEFDEINEINRLLKDRSFKLEPAEKSDRFSRLLMKHGWVKVVLGTLLLSGSWVIAVSVGITAVDRFGQCESYIECTTGYLMKKSMLSNPLDWILLFVSRFFPLDYIVLVLVVLYFFVAALYAMTNLGVRFLCFAVYPLRAKKSSPQAMLLATTNMVFISFAISCQLAWIAPQYTSFGLQSYKTPDETSAQCNLIMSVERETYPPKDRTKYNEMYPPKPPDLIKPTKTLAGIDTTAQRIMEQQMHDKSLGFLEVFKREKFLNIMPFMSGGGPSATTSGDNRHEVAEDKKGDKASIDAHSVREKQLLLAPVSAGNSAKSVRPELPGSRGNKNKHKVPQCHPTQVSMIINGVMARYPAFGTMYQYTSICFVILFFTFSVVSVGRNPKKKWLPDSDSDELSSDDDEFSDEEETAGLLGDQNDAGMYYE